MAEPTSTATAVTIASAAVSTHVLTAFGVPLGLRADVLLAGFLGSLIAIILLNTVPGSSDTTRDMVRLAFRRMAAAHAAHACRCLRHRRLHGSHRSHPF